jgi:serine carboxypeptidase-like clade 2
MKYLTDQAVLDALHISPDAEPYSFCANSPPFNYDIDYEHGSYYTYPYLIRSGIRILIYSGDVDGAVPTIGTRKWIKKLVAQLSMETVESYKPWTIVEGQVAGYKEIYEGLEFVTVKGTGHMVP